MNAERLRVLLELRPALDGYSGIPQEVRLLFRGLAGAPGICLQGLIQSANLPIEKGLRRRPGDATYAEPADEQLSRMARVVASLQQGPSATPFEHRRKMWLQRAGPIAAGLAGLAGQLLRLSDFNPDGFKDYVWRALFAKTLPVEDMDLVTGQRFRLMRWPWGGCHAFGVATAVFGHACYPRLDTRSVDVFIAETPFPGRVRSGTRMVVRYHDAMPLFMPHTVKDRAYHLATHYHALRRNAADGAWFACVSEATRQDLLRILPGLESRAVTIPNMISHHYGAESETLVRTREIVRSRRDAGADPGAVDLLAAGRARSSQFKYLLMVSTIEPRKNHLGLLEAWELLRARGMTDLHLVCVGEPGWDSQETMARLRNGSRRGVLHLLQGVSAAELNHLYQHAQATVCPSFAEGFDFSGVEAMRCAGLVAASDIPVHREVFGDGAAYFHAYSPDSMAQALESLLRPQGTARRELLRQAGQRVAARYLPAAVVPQWQDFLARVCHNPGT